MKVEALAEVKKRKIYDGKDKKDVESNSFDYKHICLFSLRSVGRNPSSISII